MAKRQTTLDRLQKYKESTGLAEKKQELPKEGPKEEAVPAGVYIGVRRVGRDYQVLELYVDEKGKKTATEYEPTNHGFAVALATDKLELACYRLHNTPWTEAEANWRRNPHGPGGEFVK